MDDALSVLVNLEHRGGTGLEKNTGDGAGILFQVPHHFFRKEAQECGQILPAEGDYGVAMLFFPQDECGVEDARRVFEEGCAEAGVPLLFWRRVPVDPHDLGETARACMPTILQAFLGRPEGVEAGDDFERRLYVCRRTVEKRADAEYSLKGKIFYVCSMSSRTVVYKGMLVATQMRRFFIDLNDAAVKTAVALVHSRYSTNTTPSWERAHPNRYIIHNGEINTLTKRLGDIWGCDHHGYINRVRSACDALGYPGRFEVLLGQLVNLLRNGKPVKMSKRRGTMITFRELVDEVGADAARYTLISRSSNQEIDFDIEKVKAKTQDNPVYYVQYAHARICSILRRAADVTPEEAAALGMDAVAARAIGENVDYALLTDPTELALSRKLSELSELIASCARDRAPFRLTHYAEELAGDFHSFYAACQVLPSEGRPVDPALSRARLAACDAGRSVLGLVLSLVGVSAPQRM